MKKFFALALALVMALSLTTIAWGATPTQVENWDQMHAAMSDSNVTEIVLTADITCPFAIQTYASHIYNLSGKTIDLNGKTFSAYNHALLFEGIDFTIKNGKMVAIDNTAYALVIGLDAGDTANVLIEDVVLTGGINVCEATNVVLRNLTVTGTSYYAVWSDDGADVIIESGSYTGGSGKPAILNYDGSLPGYPAPGGLTVEGGSFSSDVTDYLAAGLVQDTNGVVKADISGTDAGYNGLYLQGTGKGDTISTYPVNLGFYKEVAPEYNEKGIMTCCGYMAYFVTNDLAYPGAYVQVNTLAEADYVAYLDAAGKVVKFYLAEISDSTYYEGTVFTNFGKGCGQVDLGKAFDKTATYYALKGVDGFVLYVTAENGSVNMKVGASYVTVNPVSAAKNAHKVAVEMTKGEYTKIYCTVCGAEAIKAANFLSIPEGADTTGLTAYGNWYWPATAGTTTGTLVTSAQTFDAGIAMYIGMSVMAAAGGAVVLKKRED